MAIVQFVLYFWFLKIICISNIKRIIYGILIFNDKIYNMALKGLFRKKTVQDILKQVEKILTVTML
jgi:hypothetical protein